MAGFLSSANVAAAVDNKRKEMDAPPTADDYRASVVRFRDITTQKRAADRRYDQQTDPELPALFTSGANGRGPLCDLAYEADKGASLFNSVFGKPNEGDTSNGSFTAQSMSNIYHTWCRSYVRQTPDGTNYGTDFTGQPVKVTDEELASGDKIVKKVKASPTVDKLKRSDFCNDYANWVESRLSNQTAANNNERKFLGLMYNASKVEAVGGANDRSDNSYRADWLKECKSGALFTTAFADYSAAAPAGRTTWFDDKFSWQWGDARSKNLSVQLDDAVANTLATGGVPSPLWKYQLDQAVQGLKNWLPSAGGFIDHELAHPLIAVGAVGVGMALGAVGTQYVFRGQAGKGALVGGALAGGVVAPVSEYVFHGYVLCFGGLNPLC